jgi:transglutaminase-like putative cysteine protease
VLDQYFAPSLAYPGQVQLYTHVDFDERGGSPADKMRMIRQMISDGAHDPLINELASSIVHSCPARDDYCEAQALLTYVQEKQRYTEEGEETFRDAVYTATHGFSDCDDATILFGALAESIGIPTRVEVISKRIGLLRYEPIHVYPLVGLPHRAPEQWIPAETTLHVPLGWDPAVWAEQHADKL